MGRITGWSISNKRKIKQDVKAAGFINWEIGIDICTLLYIKEIIKTYCIAQGTQDCNGLYGQRIEKSSRYVYN